MLIENLKRCARNDLSLQQEAVKNAQETKKKVRVVLFALLCIYLFSSMSDRPVNLLSPAETRQERAQGGPTAGEVEDAAYDEQQKAW